MTKDYVPQFMRQDCCQAGFIGQHVDQAAAQHDGVPNREGLESRSHQNAAAYFRIDLNIVGYFEVIDHGI